MKSPNSENISNKEIMLKDMEIDVTNFKSPQLNSENNLVPEIRRGTRPRKLPERLQY